MISPDTLAAALRVDQHAAHRAMLAVRAGAADDQEDGETPSDDAANGAATPAAEGPEFPGALSSRQDDQAMKQGWTEP